MQMTASNFRQDIKKLADTVCDLRRDCHPYCIDDFIYVHQDYHEAATRVTKQFDQIAKLRAELATATARSHICREGIRPLPSQEILEGTRFRVKELEGVCAQIRNTVLRLERRLDFAKRMQE